MLILPKLNRLKAKDADTACSKSSLYEYRWKENLISMEELLLSDLKSSKFVKLLIEKRNTYVSTDDLYVAVYGE